MIPTKKLRAILASEGITAGGEIPRRVQQFAQTLHETIIGLGARGTVRAFNSGYVGVRVTIPGIGDYVYLDQPGVVGLEDQNGAYVYFGKSPVDERRALFYKKHEGRRFGDVNFSKEQIQDYNEEVLMALENLVTAPDTGYRALV